MKLTPNTDAPGLIVEAQIDALLQQMSLAEKIGQMTQVEKNSLQPEDVTHYFIGSVLSGGGGNPTPNTPATWRDMVRGFQSAALETRLRIPLLYGADAVHGHNNVCGAVIFPHNVGLGATHDADLVARTAQITARELLATGVHWNFAPAVSVPQDVRWGRSYEGFSEDTALVTALSVAYVRALQDLPARVLASIKHFVGDGGTQWGTSPRYAWLTGNWQAPNEEYSIDQGITDCDEATLRAIHLPPYQAAIEAGALNIMVSLSSWNGLKMHAQHHLLTDVLKGELGFQGFLVSDWMGVNQIDEDYATSVVRAINAGLDMVMVPFDYKRFITTLTDAVDRGQVALSRIDDAVRRILRAKVWLGLFEQPYGDDSLLPEVGCDAHRAVAREAVARSLVRLKNAGDLLPLDKQTPLLIAGRGANDIGMQCGGWSIAWQGARGQITTGTTILEGIRQALPDEVEVAYNAAGEFAMTARVGIVVVGEAPYAEGVGDRGDLALSAEDSAVIERLRGQVERLVVILLSGRPMIVTAQLAQADAFIAAWLPGTEGQGVADALFGDVPFSGTLAYAWPRSMAQVPAAALAACPEGPLFPRGYGL